MTLNREQTARQFLSHLGRAESPAEVRAIVAAAGKGPYRWGELTRRDYEFQPSNWSGDAATRAAEDLMHRRTRSEKRNNGQVKRAIEALTDLVVGSGIETYADAFDPILSIEDLTPRMLDELIGYSLQADDLHEEWFHDPKQYSVCGKLTGPQMQRLAFSECMEVGSAFVLRTSQRGPGSKVPLSYQLLERDQLDLSHDGPLKGTGERVTGGIHLDAWNRELGFWVYDAHPYDVNTTSAKSTYIPASRMDHLYMFDRPSQNSGVTWLHAIGQNTFDRDAFIGAELQAAKKAALLLLVAKIKNLADLSGTLGFEDGLPSTDASGNPVMKLGNSPVAFTVGADDEVKLVESERPTDKAESFISILDHDTAGAVGIAYNTLTGRYEDATFSSTRAACLAEDLHVAPIQKWMGAMLVKKQRLEFHKLAIAGGMLSKYVSPSVYLENPSLWNRFDCWGPGRQMVDPEAEVYAAQGAVRSCFSTLKIEAARQGMHWIRLLRQRALENRLAEVLGVVMDFSKGQGGQVDPAAKGEKAPPAKTGGRK